MTRDDIIRMAREAGLCDENGRDSDSIVIVSHVERFAALVAAAEREACAKVCEENWHECGGQCANVIRYGARGQE